MKTKILSKYYLIVADFKTVAQKFLAQGVDKAVIESYFEKFKELNKKNKIKDLSNKSIDFWGKQDFSEFKSFVDKLSEVKTGREQRKVAKTGAELVAENDEWEVRKIKTFEANKLYCAGTRWCIAQQEHWDNYAATHNFYFVLSKTKPKEDPLYKIALTVNPAGEITIFDAEDRRIRLPAGVPHFATAAKETILSYYKKYGLDDKVKAYLKDLGAVDFDSSVVYTEKYKNIQDWASDIDRDFNEALTRAEESHNLIEVASPSADEKANLFDHIMSNIKDSNRAKIVDKIKKELEPFEEEYELDLDRLSGHSLRDVLEHESLSLNDALASAYYSGWETGTSDNYYGLIKQHIESLPYVKVMGNYLLDGPILKGWDIGELLQKHVMDPDEDLNDLVNKLMMESPDHLWVEPQYIEDFSNEAAVERFLEEY